METKETQLEGFVSLLAVICFLFKTLEGNFSLNELFAMKCIRVCDISISGIFFSLFNLTFLDIFYKFKSKWVHEKKCGTQGYSLVTQISIRRTANINEKRS